jgi:membrane-bound serine protease (ClpP class)
MSHRILLIVLLAFASPVPALSQGAAPVGAIWVLELNGAVGPATSDYLVRGIEKANNAAARLVVIRMNTPGGLDTAMRDIIAAILASEAPVVSWVSPQGARAASAGTYILYASHIAAMAPATHLGAATPVSLGNPGSLRPEQPDDGPQSPGTTAMERKAVNDAAAYIRGLAKLRGRNAEWAEQAVRDAVSLSAEEALAENVIDLLAANQDELLAALENRVVPMAEGDRVLVLAGAPVHEARPDWRTEFLSTITNPNLVLILGLLGFYGVLLEFYNPGSLVPGTIGIICLLLAGYSLQLLPVNYAGLALLLLGLGLMVAEALSPSFGILGIGGVAAFTFGGIILFDSDLEAFQVAWPVILAIAVVSAGFIIVTISIALRIRHQSVTTGIEHMIGQHGIALENFDTEGEVRIGGEIWHAHTATPLVKDDRVIVETVTGLSLTVVKEPS